MEKTGDYLWGHLAATEHFGRESKNYLLVEQRDLHQSLYKDCARAAHCMFYARSEERIFDIYNPRMIVLMQLRFDGYIGFPGGGIDMGEEVVNGVNRELVEEMNVDLSKYSVRDSDLVAVHYCPDKKLCLYFYAREVSLDDLVSIERDALKAEDFGSEVLGNIRVPLYTMGDGYRGFPAFISNMFVGNAREQLFIALKMLGIMTAEEISTALNAKPAPLLEN